MAALGKRGGQSFAADRRLIVLSASLKSPEAIAKALGRTPESVAKSARRIGVSLKSRGSLKAKR